MIVISYRHWGRPSVVNIRSALFFVRSGWIDLPLTAGTFRGAGAGGVWWSSRAYSTATYAYDLYLQTSGAVAPSNYSTRYLAFPLRCLSTVPGMWRKCPAEEIGGVFYIKYGIIEKSKEFFYGKRERFSGT